MEGLAPSLRLILTVGESLQRGESIRQGIKNFIEQDASPFSESVTRWIIERDRQANGFAELRKLTRSELYLLKLLERGLRGEPILPALRELETEIVEKCELQIDEFIETLPLKSLVPLLLFIFPAYLLLLLGPLVESLTKGLQ
ncbi:MAG: hypothetical protein C5B49_10380 [Bdellovibrio sp.]|nr:MAG: hypothetical protein C5B49_10380 [Bdellovibrio sp.]